LARGCCMAAILSVKFDFAVSIFFFELTLSALPVRASRSPSVLVREVLGQYCTVMFW
jgi:hypothetical protein